MAGFFSETGGQPQATKARGTALFKAALGSQPIRDRIATFQAEFSFVPELLTDGQHFYSRSYLGMIEAQLAFLGAKFANDPGKTLDYLTKTTAALNEALAYANSHTHDIVKNPSSAASFKLSKDLRIALSDAVGATDISVVFPLVPEAATKINQYNAEVMSDINLQTADLKIKTTTVQSSMVWNVYHYIIATAVAAERCFLSVGRIAAAYRFVKPVKAMQTGKFGNLVDETKTYGVSIMPSQHPHVIGYRTNPNGAAALNNLIATLADDIPIRAGVMSGDTLDPKTYPTPEHYILIIGAFPMPEFGAVIFLFWDPDTGTGTAISSNPNPLPRNFGFLFAFYETSKTRPGLGGKLFFSTGCSIEDLRENQLLKGVPFIGGLPLLVLLLFFRRRANFHRFFPKRHRYQVLSLWDST